METKSLPDNASLDQLRAQAKELRRACSGGNPAALTRVRAVRPGARPDIQLRDAQLVVAREYGFDGWRDLVAAAVRQQSGGRDLHRWFAVELNNGSWDVLDAGLSESSPRDEREQALYAAYASTYHWMQAGNVANHGRGEYLIASVATATGQLDVASRHAERYAELIGQHPAAFADWDAAFAAEARARIASRAGDPGAGGLKAEAVKLAEGVAGAADQRICLDRLAAPPW
ncbi:MAG TPA: hypothetical protein VGG16_21135 [Streptosporangiaceae bacterium]|jgi:hypothetical protein